MRYDAEHKQRTHERLRKEAAKAVRREGPHRVGVAQVMAKAGLTHGGFYAHFASRDALVAEAIDQMFEEGAERFRRSFDGRSPAEGLADYIDFYLSREHRDSRTTGCPLPFLSADAPRLPAPARARFVDGVRDLEARFAGELAKLGRPDAEADASSLLAELVGALSLARAEPDAERADALLARSRERLKRRFDL